MYVKFRLQRTVVRQLYLTLACLTREKSVNVARPDLLQKSLRILPRNRQAWYRRFVRAFGPVRVLICRISGRCRVAGINGQKLNRSSLHRCRVARWASRIGLITIFHSDRPVVPRIAVDDDTGLKSRSAHASTVNRS